MEQLSDAALPAVFLDRDGVINAELDRVMDPAGFALLPGVAAAVRKLNEAGFLVVVVTNQSAVARGWCTEEELAAVHQEMGRQLGAAGAFVDAIYYCPHHPDASLQGGRPEYLRACECRKPKPGMLLRAAQDLSADLPSSWMVGDATRDIRAGQAAGVRSILVATGKGGSDGQYEITPEHSCSDLAAAVEHILACSPVVRPEART